MTLFRLSWDVFWRSAPVAHLRVGLPPPHLRRRYCSRFRCGISPFLRLQPNYRFRGPCLGEFINWSIDVDFWAFFLLEVTRYSKHDFSTRICMIKSLAFSGSWRDLSALQLQLHGAKNTKCLVCSTESFYFDYSILHERLRICFLQNVTTLSLICVSLAFWIYFFVVAYFGLDVDGGFNYNPDCVVTMCESYETESSPHQVAKRETL